eukprot:scaffold123217_cov49-Attheya_sp.AAC.3
MGFYDKFESFLELARAIKKPYMRKYTYESSQTNKLETVEVTYDNGEFQTIPESVVNTAKKIIIGLDEKGAGSGKRRQDDGDGATNQPIPKKTRRTLNGMFVVKRGGACSNTAINWERTSERGNTMRMKVRRKNSPKRLIA